MISGQVDISEYLYFYQWLSLARIDPLHFVLESFTISDCIRNVSKPWLYPKRELAEHTLLEKKWSSELVFT